MIPKDCKRLAEVDFPIAVVSRQAVKDPARLGWQEITKVEHYRLEVDHLGQLP